MCEIDKERETEKEGERATDKKRERGKERKRENGRESTRQTDRQTVHKGSRGSVLIGPFNQEQQLSGPRGISLYHPWPAPSTQYHASMNTNKHLSVSLLHTTPGILHMITSLHTLIRFCNVFLFF